MYGNNGDKQKYGDNAVPGGRRFDMRQLDPNKVDDFRERIKREEERRKQNQPSGQGSSRSYSHN